MTLPALIQKQQKLETTVRLKKFYSVMNQAILAAQSEHGDPRYWAKEEYILDENGNYDYEKYNKEAVNIFNSYLLPHLKILKLTEGKPLEKALMESLLSERYLKYISRTVLLCD